MPLLPLSDHRHAAIRPPQPVVLPPLRPLPRTAPRPAAETDRPQRRNTDGSDPDTAGTAIPRRESGLQREIFRQPAPWLTSGQQRLGRDEISTEVNDVENDRSAVDRLLRPVDTTPTRTIDYVV